MIPIKHGIQCVLLAAILVSSVMSATAELRIENAYVRGLPPGQTTTAAFMTIYNSGAGDRVLIGAASPVAKTTEIHAHSQRDGMMRMEQVSQIVIPAKAEFELAPGDHHLMLIGLTRSLQDGDQVDLVLRLADGEQIELVLPVRSVLSEPVNRQDHSHH